MIDDVPFEVDGVSYGLGFRMPAMKAYERQNGGETILDAIDAIQNKVTMVRLSALFRAACNPPVDEETADALIDKLGLAEVIRLIGEAANVTVDGLRGAKKKTRPAAAAE
jgi:hypothetical protein